MSLPFDRTEQIFSMIERYTAREGLPPSMREIRDALGISSTSTVEYHLEKLMRQGRIIRRRGISRGIEIVRPTNGTITRPFLDRADRLSILREWKEQIDAELSWVTMQLAKERLGALPGGRETH